VVNPNGLNVNQLDEHRIATGSVRDFPGGNTLPTDAIWETESDILIHAALENQNTLENSGRIKAKVLA
jgi:glutamate dehydrogenase (NAD(P)+)